MYIPIRIEFNNAKVPEFKEVRGKDWVKYGENNNYPNFLSTLMNRSAKHNAILTAKQMYISGDGVEFDATKLQPDQVVYVSRMVANINSKETMHEVVKKITLDFETFGGYYLHLIKSKDKKKITEVYHVEYSTIRSNADNTKFYYAENWLTDEGEENQRVDIKKEFYAYGTKEADKATECLIFVKGYRPLTECYPLPDYIGAVPAIITDAEIANYHRAAIQNGFQGGTMIVFKNGIPGDEEMITTKRKIEKQFTGTDRANTLVVDFVDDPNRVPEVIPLNGNDFDKRYEALNKTIQEEIFVGHKVTSPMLFGVRVEGQLGGRGELATPDMLFQQRYVKPRQTLHESVINEILGIENCISIIPLPVIMPEFSEALLERVLTKDELREMIGKQPLDTTKSAVNDAINALSPLVANKVLESMRPDEIRGLVSLPAAPIQMCKHKFTSDEDERDLQVFLKYGRSEDEFMNLKFIKTIFSQDEADLQTIQFALTNTEKAVLDIIKGAPKSSAKNVSKLLKITEKEATDIMTSLLDKGYLDDDFKPTAKGIETKVPDLTELVVMYKYELRPDAPDLVAGGESRPFCKGMMSANRLYTREEINMIGEELGNIYGEPNYDAFRRRGGWYTDPKTDIHYPACRHIWKQGIFKKK